MQRLGLVVRDVLLIIFSNIFYSLVFPAVNTYLCFLFVSVLVFLMYELYYFVLGNPIRVNNTVKGTSRGNKLPATDPTISGL